MNEITLEVPGVPAPGGSKKSLGNGRMIDDCKRNPEWRAVVAWTALQELRSLPPMDGPLAVDVVFWMPRPKYHYGTGKNAGVLKPDAPQEPPQSYEYADDDVPFDDEPTQEKLF